MSPEIHFTLGPASWPQEVLQRIMAAGAQTCRINLSHITSGGLPRWFAHVRAAAREAARPIQLGADLRSRKLRIGPLSTAKIHLAPAQTFDLVPVEYAQELLGNEREASVNCPALGEMAMPGDAVYLDDGAIRLRVIRVAARRLQCCVEVGGVLQERSGFNIPHKAVEVPALTAKDYADLDVLVKLAPDFLYLSYVEQAQDVVEVREAWKKKGGGRIKVIAKIERALALEHLPAIAAEADALCIARGDLGVEVDLPRLPAVQAEIVACASQVGVPVLLAGEVLFSLVSRPLPARGELTDVAVAIKQGCTGFVLSDETAVGGDPAGAVAWLRRIAAGVG
jgi:pyruvate kinase